MPEPIGGHRRSTIVPFIPPPEKKEKPVTEDLLHVQEHEHHDMRPTIKKPWEEIIVPRFNKLYGSARTEDGWRYVVDNMANGTILTVAGSTVLQTVKLNNTPNWLLERWPGGTQLFLCIRQFSIAPQAQGATNGAIDCQYVDNSGMIIGLGDYLSNSGGDLSLNSLIPSPVTDPGLQTLGQLAVLLNTGATPETYYWQILFSGAYMIPDLQGYDHIVRGGDNHERRYHKPTS